MARSIIELAERGNYPPESVTLKFGPQFGLEGQYAVTHSFTLRDLARFIARLIHDSDGGSIVGEPERGKIGNERTNDE